MSFLFYGLMVLAMVSWGGSWITAKLAAGYHPEVTALWRFLISTVSFLPILWWRKESFALPRTVWVWVVLAAATLAGYNLLFLAAMQFGPGGYAGVLVPTLNPLFNFLITAIIVRQGVTRRVGGGLVLGLAGGLLQILGPGFRFESFLNPGNLLLVGAALTYAALTQLSAVAQKQISVFRFSFWTSLLCTLFLLPFAWNQGPWNWGALGPDFWFNAGYLALIAGTFGTTLYFEAARRVGAARGSSFAFLVPATALGLAFIVLGEQPTWTSVVGGTLSIGAVLLIQKKS